MYLLKLNFIVLSTWSLCSYENILHLPAQPVILSEPQKAQGT